MINQTVLVLGKSSEASLELGNVLRRKISKVILQSDNNLFKKDIEEIKPEFIFLDLSLGQSEISLEILQWIYLQKKKMIIFAYTESTAITSVPELIAHGIELGLEGCFSVPINENELEKALFLALKGQNSQQKKLLQRPQKALLKLQMKIISIDENGIKLKSPHYLSKGTSFLFKDPLCMEIFNQSSIEMRVTRTSQMPTSFDYEIFIEPKDANELTGLALRRYIMSQH